MGADSLQVGEPDDNADGRDGCAQHVQEEATRNATESLHGLKQNA